MDGPYRGASSGPEEIYLGPVSSMHWASYRSVWIGVALLAVVGGVAITIHFGLGALVYLVPALAVVAMLAAFAIPLSIVLHQEGLEVRRCVGKSRRIRFDACESVYRKLVVIGGPVLTAYALRLMDADGRVVQVHASVSNAVTLFEAIDKTCIRPVRRAAFKAFDDGEVLTFGPVELDRAGLRVERDAFGWNELERVDVGGAMLRFHVGGGVGRRTIEFGQIPYPLVLVALLGRAGATLEGNRALIQN